MTREHENKPNESPTIRWLKDLLTACAVLVVVFALLLLPVGIAYIWMFRNE
jgi:hypothetical protein